MTACSCVLHVRCCPLPAWCRVVSDSGGGRQDVRGVRRRAAARGRIGTSIGEGGRHGAPCAAPKEGDAGLHRRARLLLLLGVQGEGEDTIVALV